MESFSCPWLSLKLYIYMYFIFFFQVFFEEVGNVFQELRTSLGSGHNNMGTESTGQF